MLKKLLSILTNRLVWGTVGISILALAIWIFGPQVAIGKSQPMKLELNRIIIISVIYLLWGLWYTISRRNRAASPRNLNVTDASSEKNKNQEEPQQESDLTQRFNEVKQRLKKAYFLNHTGKFRWISCFSQHYLYQLPWYMVIGAPGAGKTTALVNSGLNFPLADHINPLSLHNTGTTRDCDWWFTNDAILLDTAGRYSIPHGQYDENTDEWKRFVGLLKKYRPRQPINGVVVTISILDLLSDSPESLAKQANELRKRLLSLDEQLGIRFPIYVIISKSDLLQGFSAYFGNFDNKQREQIWGLVFPYEASTQPDFHLGHEFEHQYALLEQRLIDALPDTLLTNHSMNQRAESHLFPQQFSALRPLLRQYLDTLFVTSSFETRFIPRGIYFTSATQEGLPIDQVMGELSHYLQLSTAGSHGDSSPLTAGLPPKALEPPVPKQSFFLKKMLEDVVFREAGLASSNKWWEYRNRALHWAGYILLAAIATTLTVLWSSNYIDSKTYLTEVRTKVASLERQGQKLSPPKPEDMLSILPFLDSVLSLPESQDFPLRNPPFTYHMGLYSGDEVSTASNKLYQKALKELLLPLLVQQITNTLRNDPQNDVEFSYEALKAYQMLFLSERYDGKYLRSWVILNLQRNLPQGVPQILLQRLEWHLSQLLDNQTQISPYTKNQLLVERSQAIINQVPLSQRVYSRLKRQLKRQWLSQAEIKLVNLLTLAGPQAELVFSRKSGKPLTDSVSELFTPQGWSAFNKDIDRAVDTLREEDTWVLDSDPIEQKRAILITTIQQLYMQEFIKNWDELLNDIQLTNISNLEQRISSARLLSSPHSPLLNLLMNVSKNTLLRTDARNGLLDKTKSKLNQSNNPTLDVLFNSTTANIGDDIATQPVQAIRAHYAPWLELSRSQEQGNKAIPFDNILKQVDELYNYLTAVQGATNSGIAVPPSDIISRLQADSGRLPEPLKSMLLSLAVGASSDTQHKEMENLKQRINFEVSSFCQQEIAKRYPLSPHAKQEITPDDLAHIFAPNIGLMDKFFRDNLQGKVDTRQNNWAFTPGVDGKILPSSGNILQSFQQAQQIRNTFFAGSTPAPSYRVTVRPVRMDSDILKLTLDIDGQLFKYSHGPLVPLVVTWPGTRNTDMVSLQLTLANGSSANLTTSGPWALNRMVDMAQPSEGSNNQLAFNGKQSTFNIDGHRVTLEFIANSIYSPFQLPAFSCP
ncbi:type VI secretion system membrane subunit TssM [Yersinia bercovieri]|uniref:type VI secretion system membrane subunit TssM n=1 Tax=Yersinia bercovieri TaxID=634 RepID=UPI0005E36F29|nr:type VI secretion system membrane subunit TssM [Yersinia bercovieri]CFQ39229.1 type VI secretion protein IcmF [Yersinia bercovieri]